MPASRRSRRSLREETLANAAGIRVLQSIVSAVPVRLMKRDLLFVADQLFPLLEEKRLEMVAQNRSIKAKDGESVGKLLTAFARKTDESTLGKLVIESVILLSARTRADGGQDAPRSRSCLWNRHRGHRTQGQARVRRERQGKETREAVDKASAKDKARQRQSEPLRKP